MLAFGGTWSKPWYNCSRSLQFFFFRCMCYQTMNQTDLCITCPAGIRQSQSSQSHGRVLCPMPLLVAHGWSIGSCRYHGKEWSLPSPMGTPQWAHWVRLNGSGPMGRAHWVRPSAPSPSGPPPKSPAKWARPNGSGSLGRAQWAGPMGCARRAVANRLGPFAGPVAPAPSTQAQWVGPIGSGPRCGAQPNLPTNRHISPENRF